MSCRFCIVLGADALAALRVLYPAAFARVAAREAASGCTIKRSASLIELAQRGTPFPPALANPALARLADADVWSAPMLPASWSLPAGAYGKDGGPS